MKNTPMAGLDTGSLTVGIQLNVVLSAVTLSTAQKGAYPCVSIHAA